MMFCKVVYIVEVSKILHKIAILKTKFTEAAFCYVPKKTESADKSTVLRFCFRMRGLLYKERVQKAVLQGGYQPLYSWKKKYGKEC